MPHKFFTFIPFITQTVVGGLVLLPACVSHLNLKFNNVFLIATVELARTAIWLNCLFSHVSLEEYCACFNCTLITPYLANRCVSISILWRDSLFQYVWKHRIYLCLSDSRLHPTHICGQTHNYLFFLFICAYVVVFKRKQNYNIIFYKET